MPISRHATTANVFTNTLTSILRLPTLLLGQAVDIISHTPSLLLLTILALSLPLIPAMDEREKLVMRDKVKEMFYHGYDNYMQYAHPHDELKPLSGGYTDTLAELGNADHDHAKSSYRGVAMTLIDALPTLAVMGNHSEFKRAAGWVVAHTTFNQDVRVNVFECTIRVLGGLLSAHVLATDPGLGLTPAGYQDGLLKLAEDLGTRLLQAFVGTVIPFAWVNLRKGVPQGEMTEQCTAGVSTLLLEFGLLSHLTGNPVFFQKVDKAMDRLWSLKSGIDLLGNTFDIHTGAWKNRNSGIGAGIDSTYEYMFKAYILFGNSKYLHMFQTTYDAVNRHLRTDDNWYVEGDMRTGKHTHQQFNSLQAFWPGLQVLHGDIEQAIMTQDNFYSLWTRFGALPERYLLNSKSMHSTERYYPQRPEFVESALYLYRATKNDKYLQMGARVYDSFNDNMRVPKGFASLRQVQPAVLEDRMHSFFLSELCKYLYLLYDDDNFALAEDKFVFTTEGHLFPVDLAMQQQFGDGTQYAAWPGSELPIRNTCPFQQDEPDQESSAVIQDWLRARDDDGHYDPSRGPHPDSLLRSVDPAHAIVAEDFTVNVAEGSFTMFHISSELVVIRNLGTSLVEITDRAPGGGQMAVVLSAANLLSFRLVAPECPRLGLGFDSLEATGAYFGVLPGGLSLDAAETDRCFAGQPGCAPNETHRRWTGGDLLVGVPIHACSPLLNADQIQGKIVFLKRGECTFLDKVKRAQQAGAVGVVMSNSNAKEAEDIFMMGTDGTGREVHIPAVMISESAGKNLINCLRESRRKRSPLAVHMQLTSASSAAPSDQCTTPESETLDQEELEELEEAHVLELSAIDRKLPRLEVSGTLDGFTVHTAGGWSVAINEQDGTYLLKIY